MSSILDKYLVHYIADESYKSYINAHTHGLVENFNHKDLQIVFPLSSVQVGKTMYMLVNYISEGNKLDTGTEYSWMLPGHSVKFIEALEDNRTVFRMIISPNSVPSDILDGQRLFNPDEAHTSFYYR